MRHSMIRRDIKAVGDFDLRPFITRDKLFFQNVQDMSFTSLKNYFTQT